MCEYLCKQGNVSNSLQGKAFPKKEHREEKTGYGTVTLFFLYCKHLIINICVNNFNRLLNFGAEHLQQLPDMRFPALLGECGLPPVR